MSITEQYKKAYYRDWRTVMLLDAQTIALVGCGGPGCLTDIKGKPPVLCSTCNSKIIALLLARG